MIRDPWEPDCAEKNCVVMSDLVETIFGHHPASFVVVRATPGELLPLKMNASFSGRRIDHPNPFGHNFLANPVSRDHRNSISLHFASRTDSEIVSASQRFRRWLFCEK